MTAVDGATLHILTVSAQGRRGPRAAGTLSAGAGDRPPVTALRSATRCQHSARPPSPDPAREDRLPGLRAVSRDRPVPVSSRDPAPVSLTAPLLAHSQAVAGTPCDRGLAASPTPEAHSEETAPGSVPVRLRAFSQHPGVRPGSRTAQKGSGKRRPHVPGHTSAARLPHLLKSGRASCAGRTPAPPSGQLRSAPERLPCVASEMPRSRPLTAVPSPSTCPLRRPPQRPAARVWRGGGGVELVLRARPKHRR